jgi:hypothetical protein
MLARLPSVDRYEIDSCEHWIDSIEILADFTQARLALQVYFTV